MWSNQSRPIIQPLQTTESVNSIYRASDTTEDQWKKDQIRTRVKIDVCMKHLLYHVVVMRKWKMTFKTSLYIFNLDTRFNSFSHFF